MSCSMMAKVSPWLRSLRMVSPSASVITGLTPEVGSSSRMILGSSISARETSSRGEEGAPQCLAALLRSGEEHVLEHRELAELARDLEGAHEADLRALVR